MGNKYFNSIKNYDQHYVSFLRKRETALVLSILKENIISDSLLEVGCGTGYYSKIIDSIIGENKCIYLDSSSNLIKHVGGLTVCSDYLKNPFEKSSFNQIICLGAVEFIGEEFFQTTYNLLKNNGTVIICLPKKNIFGFFYNLFYQSKNIPIYFLTKKSKDKINELFFIDYQTNLFLNSYLVLRKK